MNDTALKLKKDTNPITLSSSSQLQMIDIENVDNISVSKPKRSRNDIKEIKSYKQLDRIELDLDSPRFMLACQNLGVSVEECCKKGKSEFHQKGIDKDLADLRFKHFQSRLIDTLNRVLLERRNIKIREMQKEIIEQKILNKSQSQQNILSNSYYKQNQNKHNVNGISISTLGVSQSLQTNNGSSIFQTEVGIVDQKRNNLIPMQLNDQSLRSHRQLPITVRQQNSPNNIKSLITKQAFKDIKSLQFNGSQTHRYSDQSTTANSYHLQPLSKTQGNSFLINKSNLNFRNNNNNLSNLAQTTSALTLNPLVDKQIQSNAAKIERDKSQKLLMIQKQLEIQEQNQQKIMEQEKKLLKAQKQVNRNLKLQTEVKKHKNELRQVEVQKRAISLTKEYEDSVLKEIDRQNQSMTMTVQKQIQLESERRQELLQREQAFQEKIKQLQEQKLEKDLQEQQSLGVMLKSIDEKLNRSSQLHELNLRRVASEARAKNNQVKEKITIFKQAQEEQQRLEKEQYQQQQEQIRKKMMATHKELKRFHKSLKQQRQQKIDVTSHKRIVEQNDIQMKLQQIQQRQKEAEEIQEQYRQEQEHEFLLRNEERRLREEDIKKLRDRQKRLQEQKKQQILEKEKEHNEFIQTLKQSENLIQKKKLEMIVKTSKEAEEIKKALFEAVKGKNITPRTKQRLEKEGIDLQQFIKKKGSQNQQNNNIY